MSQGPDRESLKIGSPLRLLLAWRILTGEDLLPDESKMEITRGGEK